MKKIIACFILAAAFMVPACVFAADNESEVYSNKEVVKYQQKVMQIGFRILNANQIEKRSTFYFDSKKDVNAFTRGSSKQVTLYRGMMNCFDDDNEIAGILSHEIAHNQDLYKGFTRRMAMSFRPCKYEKKADLKAIDYMVNAGYNPVGLIVIMNKISQEPNWFDKIPYVLMTFLPYSHPDGSKRNVYMYEYIYTKYPAYLADNEYKTNLYYQNFLLTSKKERELIRQKYADKNIVPVSNKTK